MLKRIRTIANSPVFFWALLALPSLAIMAGVYSGQPLKGLLHPAGEFAARFMILAMMITPLQMLFPGMAWPYWLMRRRRHIGVAAFGYAALHVLFYLVAAGSFDVIVQDMFRLGIWTGWLAFLIFVPLAITSNNVSVRALRRRWKPLQRWVYPAAVLTLAHWVFLKYEFGPALVHFAPLAGLELYRLWAMRARHAVPAPLSLPHHP